jgi:hypothetical protein
MVSISTAFIYRTRRASMKHQAVEIPAAENVLAIGMRTTLSQADLVHMYEEIWGTVKDKAEKKKRKVATPPPPPATSEEVLVWRRALDRLGSFEPVSLTEHVAFHALLEAHSDILRLQYIQPLCTYFVKESGTMSEEQRSKIREFDTEKLRAWCATLKTTPWELAFRETADPLDPLTKREYERASHSSFHASVLRVH